MEARTPLVLLLAVIALALCLPSAAAAESRADDHRLFVISKISPEERKQQTYAGNQSSAPIVLGLSLATNASLSDQPSRSYSMSQQGPFGWCTSGLPPFQNCGPRGAKGVLQDVGDDFDVGPVTTVHGEFHLAWKSTSSAPSLGSPFATSDVAAVAWSLKIGDSFFRGDTFLARQPSGDVVVPVDFRIQDPACEDTRDPCEPTPSNVTDVSKVTVTISVTMLYSSLNTADALGRRLDVKIDTSGGSYIDVPAAPAPPRPAVDGSAVVDAADGSAPRVAEFHGEDGKEYYVPSPVAPIAAVAILGGLWLRRNSL